MSTTVNWTNPYADRSGKWLKGNLHTHTSPASGCAKVSLERTLALYADAGYGFLSISDHMTLTGATHPQMVLLPGIEWNTPEGSGHTNVVSCDGSILAPHTKTESQVELLDDLSAKGALCILNHPDWLVRPHYRREELEVLSGFDGIEIFNGAVQWGPGSALSTDKWDYLLTKGKRVLGFASDDFHSERHAGQGWIMVRAEAKTPESVMAALKSGNFYASSGVELTDIRREGDVITVESSGGEEIQVIGDSGKMHRKIRDSAASVDFSELPGVVYIRFAIYGRGSEMAWTQPFFREA
jgi:hypothetical protein